jgi:hypothetical protein
MAVLAGLALCAARIGIAQTPAPSGVAPAGNAQAPAAAPAEPASAPAVAEPPKPSVVPTTWQLDLDFENPQPVTLQLPGEKKPRTFWYVLYKITNRTDKDRIFVPDFVMAADTGVITRAGVNIPVGVFEAIQKRHNNPLLSNLPGVTGRILQGEDNSKTSLAIWPDIDLKARAFDIFVGGLSGEREKVKLPLPLTVVVTDKDGNKTQEALSEVVLSRMLKLHYLIPSEPQSRTPDSVVLDKKDWVLR